MKPAPHLPLRRAAASTPTRFGSLLFHFKAACFRGQRLAKDLLPDSPRPLPRQPIDLSVPVAAESRSALYSSTNPAEWALQAGKVQNLRQAARALHGRVIAPGETFSFWANVGRATRSSGYVRGRELREGCIIPNVGGGLCQISNALYDVALQAGAEIIERHAHSRQVPGSQAEAGRDATVFWNYVDLRFRLPVTAQLAVELSRNNLTVRLHSRQKTRAALPPARSSLLAAAESCETCGINDCFRHASAAILPRESGVAWLVDAFQPEHDAWMRSHHGPNDHLLLPMDSSRLRIGPYRWASAGFARVHQSPLMVARRSLVSRRLAAQGAARQRALLELDKSLAEALSRRIPALATHLVISQNLLPFLWQYGVLGGRTFDVLMTRLPIRELEKTLDAAARRHPGSPTLSDFRAPSEIGDAEGEALAAANRWITPHTAIARLAGARACLLPWRLPPSRRATPGHTVAFPASTLARKGALELREAVRDLDLRLQLGGPILESADFWQGVDARPAGPDWLEGVAAVVLPAWVEHQPRRLLQAVSAGVPVIASEACGLCDISGVTTIPTGDSTALREALTSVLRKDAAPA